MLAVGGVESHPDADTGDEIKLSPLHDTTNGSCWLNITPTPLPHRRRSELNS